MRELILFMARSLVSKPEEVDVTETERGGMLVLELRVAPEDMGKVIGRQGRIAKAMRSLLKAASMREGVRAVLEIV